MTKLFERNPRNIRIASWMMALGLCFAWYKYDERKELQFTDKDAAQWNEAILRMHPQKPSKKKEKHRED
uniref:Uncharacterized protein n=1 Tax=Peronospora matthiolae TaxID=2874970 RepID=A0AAV1UNP2_9STRA